MTAYGIVGPSVGALVWLVVAVVTFRQVLLPPAKVWVGRQPSYARDSSALFGVIVAGALAVLWPVTLPVKAVEQLLNVPKERRARAITAARLHADHCTALAELETDPIVSGSYRQQAETARHTAARLEAGVRIT